MTILLFDYLCVYHETVSHTGETLLLLVGGTDCLEICGDAMNNVNTENTYISPNSEQGTHDTETLMTICELTLTM